jgi:hypothetical protein
VIRPLRRAHRVGVAVLAVVLPVLFALALLAREARSGFPDPTSGAGRAGELAAGAWAEEVWPGAGVRVKVGSAPGATDLLVEISFDDPPRVPDLLAYWAPGVDRDTEGVPPGATLLGAIRGAGPERFALPRRPGSERGWLFLYDLGHARVVASGPLPRTTGAHAAE